MSSRRSNSIMASRGEIPTYTIDLSLPPSKRYEHIANDFKEHLCGLPAELDKTIHEWIKNPMLRFLFKNCALRFMRRLYSHEEMEEVKGIAKVSGANLRSLVAFNVLLDSLMCCTSGGVLVDSKSDLQPRERMMHFRTLDWGSQILRSMIVVLEYVNSNSSTPTKVIGRSITYAGFVGILTGVRKDLSVSMNFRPKSTLNQLPLRFHQLLVLTGFRPPIATTLRSLIIPTTTSTPPSIARASSDIRCRTLSPCHIILCNGYYTTIIEKDLNTHSTRSSRSFITQTNHDITHWLARNELADGDRFAFPDSQTNPYPAPPSNFDREDPEIIRKYFPYLCWEDSKNRYEFLREQWIVVPDEPGQDTPAVAVEKVKSWIRQEPVNNEETHFMCLLDPLTGEIQWLERGREANLDV